jgi:protein gp37
MSASIQWTDDTFNCITGCTRVSEGCRNCYAERLSATRLRLSHKYKGVAEHTGAGPRWTGQIRLHPELLSEPLRWRRRPSRRNSGGQWMVFVNDMSDTFHPGVPHEFLDKMFAMFACTPGITWQALTKRPERMREYLKRCAGGRHYLKAAQEGLDWLEGKEKPYHGGFRPRPDLRMCCRCGDIHDPEKRYDHQHHRGLDWVIVGGESGPKAGRSMCNMLGVRQWPREVL